MIWGVLCLAVGAAAFIAVAVLGISAALLLVDWIGSKVKK